MTSISQKMATGRVWKELRKNKRFLFIDLALIISFILLITRVENNLYFHLLFVLLIYGSFFWSLMAFFYRAGLWVPIATIAQFIGVFQGKVGQEELVEIPLLVFILLMVFGISRRRSIAEKALRNSEKQYRRLVELVFESIVIISDGKFAFVNAQAVRLFNASSPKEMLGNSFGDYLPPASFEGFKILSKQAIDEDGELPLIEEQLICPGNKYVDIEAAGLAITYQDQDAILLVIRNITERKRAEKTLRDSHKRFQELLESAPDAVIECDKNGLITLVNARTEEMFGYCREELIGRDVELLLPEFPHYPETNDDHEISRLEADVQGSVQELSGLRKDASEFPADIKIGHHFTEEGPRITTIIRDITERKLAEEQLIRAARLAALGQMSTAIAHELNNPLQIIKGYLDIILDFSGDWEEKLSYLQIIRQQINRMSGEAQQVLNFARPKQQAKQFVEPAALIEQVLKLAEKELQNKGMQVELDLHAVPPIIAAPDALMQIFLNLTINAIESGAENNGHLQIKLFYQQNKVNINFLTRGINIQEKDLPFIFDPFFTTKSGGSGLGLWISRNLVEKFQGTLTAENLPGGDGVVFSAQFPAAEVMVEQR